MIIFDRKSKDLEIPKSLGNVAVDVASGTTDAITRDELRETVSRANERTLAAAERYAAEEARGAVSVANAYTDGVVAESSAATLDQAKDYTDSAITLTDYDYVLRAAANAGDVNAFLQWASQFDENDLKKIRVFYKMRVLRFENANLSQGWMSLQGVDATYMHNNRIYVSRLGFNADQAPSWDERAYDLNTFVNSAQTKEIVDSAITKNDFDFVLDWGAGAAEVNAFLQWALSFPAEDLPKIRVFYGTRVLRYENHGKDSNQNDWMALQGADTTYMHNDRLYLSRLGMNANQAPDWDDRAYDLSSLRV